MFNNDLDLINVKIYNNKNGKLYDVELGLNCNEIALLDDIIHQKIPKTYYKIATTAKSMSVVIKMPYSNTTKTEYTWVFPVSDKECYKNSYTKSQQLVALQLRQKNRKIVDLALEMKVLKLDIQ
jgi:hypothetical protein